MARRWVVWFTGIVIFATITTLLLPIPISWLVSGACSCAWYEIYGFPWEKRKRKNGEFRWRML